MRVGAKKMNKIILLGRLTKDPEIRKTPTDKSVCTFTLAVDRPFSGRDGKKTFEEAIIREVPFVRNLDAPVSSIVPLAAKTQYPLAVVDEHDVFRGIVTKASVLSSLSV